MNGHMAGTTLALSNARVEDHPHPLYGDAVALDVAAVKEVFLLVFAGDEPPTTTDIKLSNSPPEHEGLLSPAHPRCTRLSLFRRCDTRYDYPFP